MLFELTVNQFDSMKASVDSLKQTIENLTKTNQELVKKQELKNQEILKHHELIKSLKTLLHSKNADLDALKRLLFQGGREQNEQPVPTGKSRETAE